jgi:SAM-dependent methyltransferase
MPRAPLSSVRGRVRNWIEKHADGLGPDVLEVGSRVHRPEAWWTINRDLAKGQWTGIDMQPGQGVDLVADIHKLPEEWGGRFSGVLCSEVLEHVARPWIALPELRRVMAPGGLLIVTTLTAFPIHGFPDDFYRYTEHGLRLLLEDAGFSSITTGTDGSVEMLLNDHGEPGMVRRFVPMHVFAVARC